MRISRLLRRAPFRLRSPLTGALALGVVFLFAASSEIMAQSTAVASKPQPARHAKNKKKDAKALAAKAIPTPAPTPAPTPQPERPNWPVNNSPSRAAIGWDSNGLRVVANNSSLQQILKDVSDATGIEIEGLSTDERVFGSYGPGPASEVLSHLLLGSSYNVVMIGEQSRGTPRQLVLSSRENGAAATNSYHPSAKASSDDDDDAQEPEPPAEPASSHPGQGFGGGAPHTPQQMMEEMRQRQQDQQQPPQDGNGPEQH